MNFSKINQEKEIPSNNDYDNDDERISNYTYDPNDQNNNCNESFNKDTNENTIEYKNDKSENMDIEEEDSNTINEQDINNKEDFINIDSELLFNMNQEEKENNLAIDLESFQEKHNNVNITEFAPINETIENFNVNSNNEIDSENEEVIENENHISKEENDIKLIQGLIIRLLISLLPRMYAFNEAKNVIYNKCGSNALDSIKQLLIPLGIDEDLLILTTNDKFGHSFNSNREFFLREIGDLISNSYQKNVTESNKNAKKEKIKLILEKEMNDETKEIKVINAIFNLRFLD